MQTFRRSRTLSILVPVPNLPLHLFMPICLWSHALTVTLAISAEVPEELISKEFFIWIDTITVVRDLYLTIRFRPKLPKIVSVHILVRVVLFYRIYSMYSFSLLIFVSLSKRFTRASKNNSRTPHIFEVTPINSNT